MITSSAAARALIFSAPSVGAVSIIIASYLSLSGSKILESIFSAPISRRSFASTADKTIEEEMKSTPLRLIMYSSGAGSSSSSICAIIR